MQDAKAFYDTIAPPDELEEAVRGCGAQHASPAARMWPAGR